ncbi:MAG: hypothetical protein FJY67_11405 [Calditrichaeota bacterium]|nr:hypothetical protein [Calditrichota bacterium]
MNLLDEPAFTRLLGKPIIVSLLIAATLNIQLLGCTKDPTQPEEQPNWGVIPNAPSDLTITKPDTNSHARISWQDNSNNEFGFIFEIVNNTAYGRDTLDANTTNTDGMDWRPPEGKRIVNVSDRWDLVVNYRVWAFNGRGSSARTTAIVYWAN